MNYTQKLNKAIRQNASCLCVGLDPNLNRIPESIRKSHPDEAGQAAFFLKKVIDVTNDCCAAYKPNLGFFEALGAQGLTVFQEIIEYIPDEKVIIADAKRGDISSTAEHYARAYFEVFNVDAVTLNPLMGFESLTPFLQYPEKGAYILALTSNPGADDFLKQFFRDFPSMAAYIAERLLHLQESAKTHLGMVVGATQAAELQSVIHQYTEGALLIPGLGAQGGSVSQLVDALEQHRGIPLVNSSRSILYAGEGADWTDSVRAKALEFKKLLQPITDKYVS